jgi:hypothetical protein
MFISEVGYFVLASIGAGALAYSPVIVLGLYVSLHEDRTGVEAARSASQPKGRAMSETLQEVRRRTSDVTWPRDSESLPMAGAPGERRNRTRTYPGSRADGSVQGAEQVQLNQGAV